MSWLATRQREDEWMDRPDVAPAELAHSLRFIRKVNWLLGYTRATIWHLQRFSRDWRPGERITVLDVATGSADIPAAIHRWAGRRKFDVHVVGLDRHGTTAQIAQRATGGRIPIIQGDALSLPFADASFDYVTTSMFLHHLDEGEVAQVLREMDRVARRGVVAADLLRSRRAYVWIWLFTLPASPMLRHDARVSVAQAFTREEVLALRDRAGLHHAGFFHHFGHRFVLAAEKQQGKGQICSKSPSPTEI